MILSMNIVKNDHPKPLAEKPLKCQARLIWKDAVTSDGTTCNDEMLNKLLDGVKLDQYAPPLCLQHDWDVKNVIGKMTGLKIDGDALMAEFDVTDPEAQDKISAGVWDSVSLSYELPDFKIMECSLVAVPAIPGAKIEAVKATEPEAEAEKPAEEKPAETEAEKSAEPAEAEKIEVTVKDDVAENACKDRENACGPEDEKSRVDNARTAETRIVQMAKRIEDLEKQNKELSDLIVLNERRTAAESRVREWIQNGKTAPAVKDKEIAFLMSLDKEQAAVYEQLKAAAMSNSKHGVRLSAPVGLAKTREEEFAEGYKAFLEKAKR